MNYAWGVCSRIVWSSVVVLWWAVISIVWLVVSVTSVVVVIIAIVSTLVIIIVISVAISMSFSRVVPVSVVCVPPISARPLMSSRISVVGAMLASSAMSASIRICAARLYPVIFFANSVYVLGFSEESIDAACFIMISKAIVASKGLVVDEATLSGVSTGTSRAKLRAPICHVALGSTSKTVVLCGRDWWRLWCVGRWLWGVCCHDRKGCFIHCL